MIQETGDSSNVISIPDARQELAIGSSDQWPEA